MLPVVIKYVRRILFGMAFVMMLVATPVSRTINQEMVIYHALHVLPPIEMLERSILWFRLLAVSVAAVIFFGLWELLVQNLSVRKPQQ